MMLHDVTDCCSVLCMLKKRWASVQRLHKFLTACSELGSFVNFANCVVLRKFCENLLRTFAAHFADQAALSQRGTARGTSHRQDGAQPITSFTAFRSDIHSSPRLSKRLWPICVRLFQAPAQWLEMRELHQAYLQKSSAREPRNGESALSNCDATASREKKLESAWLTVAGC